MQKGNRTILHTVHEDNGALELYWARGADDHLLTYQGSLLFHTDGSLTFKCWSDEGEPYVVQIINNRIIVARSEDQPPAATDYIFDTEAL